MFTETQDRLTSRTHATFFLFLPGLITLCLISSLYVSVCMNNKKKTTTTNVRVLYASAVVAACVQMAVQRRSDTLGLF